ncbi:MAG: tRNA pseudouridine(38-40) synthase TruA [Anaerovibrio sp.]|uniref:tRNA pseudouridine(38-40) synthase TruA n=1 Tax=Anaerovibrio sp. TaxID=1872532 RepID=UPI00260CC119|nr:tRNA pseudouridine(38-40) synthase TruA [Anaerovibrio sp.]MDD7677247.1 tRNA pseudouridine(38-40) synthase TruA [Anaerovibrio sp.]MDY2603442.1 tRNA pseudouridine(38-40) synthase TruA [Anaerovibrio sp.]
MKPEHKEIMKARRRNIRLTVSYDGTAYNGFQRQNPPQVAVQNVLEEKLSAVCGDSVELAASGRTDSGVHAIGQVVNFFTDGTIPLDRLPRAVNSILPPDIVVLEAAEADRDFSARHSAKSKIYIYRILQGYIPDPFERNYSWNIHKELDTDSMEKCLRMIEGTHDFSAFRAAGGPPVSPVRTIYEASLEKKGRIVELKFFANGFLYHMVRNLVGSLVNVGMGRTSVQRFGEIMASLDRNQAGATAPARGLYLYKVNY